MSIERTSGDLPPREPEIPKNTKLNITVGIIAVAALGFLGAALGAHFGVAHLGFLQGHTIQLISKVVAGVGTLAVIGRVVHSILQTLAHKKAIQNYQNDLSTHYRHLHRQETLHIQSENFADAMPLEGVNDLRTIHSTPTLEACSSDSTPAHIGQPVWTPTHTAKTRDDSLSFSRTGASKAEAKSIHLMLGTRAMKVQLCAADGTKLPLNSFPKTLEAAYKKINDEVQSSQNSAYNRVMALFSTRPTPLTEQEIFSKALAATYKAIGVTDETPLTAIVEFDGITYLANQGSNETLFIEHDQNKVYRNPKKDEFSVQTVPTEKLKQVSIVIGTKDSWIEPAHVGQPLLNAYPLSLVFDANMAEMYPAILDNKKKPVPLEPHAMMAYSPYPIAIRV